MSEAALSPPLGEAYCEWLCKRQSSPLQQALLREIEADSLRDEGARRDSMFGEAMKARLVARMQADGQDDAGD